MLFIKESCVMKYILIFILLYGKSLYGQGFECDNNFGDCGTPEQSGGGGGGGGSVLVTNTDLGDTYQNADDFDDDGIEDSSDNCPRVKNPNQLDRDGDKIGDLCDNCINTWNSYQEDNDGDSLGDYCDRDDDNDGIIDSYDDCPYHWGKDYCFLDYDVKPVLNKQKKYNIMNKINKNQAGTKFDKQNVQNCNTIYTQFNKSLFYFLFALYCLIHKKRRKEDENR